MAGRFSLPLDAIGRLNRRSVVLSMVLRAMYGTEVGHRSLVLVVVLVC